MAIRIGIPKPATIPKTFTADLTGAAAAFGFQRMILIGHSLGADVAIRFAADNAAQVAALVIVDFGPELDERGIDEILRSFAATPPSFESQEHYADWLIARRPLADPTLLRQFARQSLREASPRDWRPKADAALASRSQISRNVASDGRYRDPDLWPMLARIACPESGRARQRVGRAAPGRGESHVGTGAVGWPAGDHRGRRARRDDGQPRRILRQRRRLPRENSRLNAGMARRIAPARPGARGGAALLKSRAIGPRRTFCEPRAAIGRRSAIDHARQRTARFKHPCCQL